MVPTMRVPLVALAWLSCQCEGFSMMGRSPMPSLRSQRVFLASAPGRRSMVVPKRLITMQVWSSEQSTQEYRDLLNGVVPEKTEDGPSVIVGGHGKLGDFLREKGAGEDILVGRGDEIPGEMRDVGENFPIYVCVPEEEVESIIRACPKNKVDDMVFLCEGNIEPVLKKYGLCGNENTQAVLNFKIMSKGARPQDFRVDMGTDSFGEPKIAGETVVCGKWADALMARLERANIQSSKLYYRDWRRHMIEKTVFDSLFNLVGVLHDGITLGEVSKYYYAEVEDMALQVNAALRGSLAVTLLYGFEERMFAMADGENQEWRATKMDKFKWRNGFIYAISNTAKQVGFDDPVSMHTEYLEYAKNKGFITEELEPYNPYA